jgi:hypothetical protein
MTVPGNACQSEAMPGGSDDLLTTVARRTQRLEMEIRWVLCAVVVKLLAV